MNGFVGRNIYKAKRCKMKNHPIIFSFSRSNLSPRVVLSVTCPHLVLQMRERCTHPPITACATIPTFARNRLNSSWTPLQSPPTSLPKTLAPQVSSPHEFQQEVGEVQKAGKVGAVKKVGETPLLG